MTMEPNLTDDEMKMFEAVQSQREWRAACDAVKAARGGRYPSDWWPRMKLTGKMGEILGRFGASSELRVQVIEHDDDQGKTRDGSVPER